MPNCKLIVKDQCNVKFEELDPVVRRKINEALKIMVPNARHMPQYKLGRWDGTISFCTVGGATHLNLLDRILPIIYDSGYEIEVDDRRPEFNLSFPEITENMFAHKVWPEGHERAGQPIILRDYQVEAIKAYIENLQSIQEISTGAGKCLDYATEIDIEISEESSFGKFLLNTVEFQEISTGEGLGEISTRDTRKVMDEGDS